MTATQVQLKESTVEFMNELMESNYYDGDMYVFINEYGEDNFVNSYEQYVELGEKVSYDAVDAFIAEFGMTELDNFLEAYYGEWSSFQSFSESFFADLYAHQIPEHLHSYIDYDAFARDLSYDFVINGDYVFNRNF
jgi:antirestriction protein